MDFFFLSPGHRILVHQELQFSLEHSSPPQLKFFTAKLWLCCLPSANGSFFFLYYDSFTLQFDSFSKCFVLVGFFCFICFVRNLKVLSGALFLTHLLSSLSSSQSFIPNHSPFSLTLTPMASLTAFSDSIQSIFFPSHIYFTHLEHIYRVKAFYSHSSQDSLPPALE